jgi:hypothetical protein
VAEFIEDLSLVVVVVAVGKLPTRAMGEFDNGTRSHRVTVGPTEEMGATTADFFGFRGAAGLSSAHGVPFWRPRGSSS